VLFACAWVQAGYGLPAGFDSTDARPPTQVEREYQLQRGPGHGRGLMSAAAVDPRARAGLSTSAAFTAAGADGIEPGCDYDSGSDDEMRPSLIPLGNQPRWRLSLIAFVSGVAMTSDSTL
jgi:hypothetical protein